MSSNKAVAGKIIEAWKEIGSIPKNGKNPKFNYAFVREEDAADAIRRAFIKVGLSVIPSVEKLDLSIHKTAAGAEMQHAIIHMKFTITDKDTGESDSFVMVGEAMDNFDKAVYKAITGATKYAYVKLALSGSEDNEEDDAGPPQQPKAPTPVPQGASFRKPEPAPKPQTPPPTPPTKPEPQPKAEKPAPAPIQEASPAPAQAPTTPPPSDEVPTMDLTGKITAVIPAMKNKPATLTVKPNSGANPVAIQFNPQQINVPELLKMQSSKADVRVVCDITSGAPFLMLVEPAAHA